MRSDEVRCDEFYERFFTWLVIHDRYWYIVAVCVCVRVQLCSSCPWATLVTRLMSEVTALMGWSVIVASSPTHDQSVPNVRTRRYSLSVSLFISRVCFQSRFLAFYRLYSTSAFEYYDSTSFTGLRGKN